MIERANRYGVIPQEVLKLIACVTMLIDHIGAALVIRLSVPCMPTLYYICRVIGRIAFPIYAFLLCQGMQHTHSPKKYIFRLAAGILLAEIPFDFLFEGGFTWAYQSVMVTLTLGALMLLCMSSTSKLWLRVLVVFPFTVLAELVRCDYGGWGIATIAAFTLIPNLPGQVLCMILINWLMSTAAVPVLGLSIPIQLFAVLAMVPIGFYSGKKCSGNRALQLGFYLFYPVHLLILWGITLL